MQKATRRILPLFLVAALLAMPWAVSAAGSQARPALSDSGDLFVRLWRLLPQPWTKNGCDVDPSGRCLTKGSSPVAVDNGCELDPNGGRCPTTTKNGCEVDPDGRCVR